jgi:hypothetical protein
MSAKAIVIEELPPEICQQCGNLDELRPYGKRQPNGARLWVCFDGAMQDEGEAQRAFVERLEKGGSI